MRSIYDNKRIWKLVFLIVAAIAIVIFLLISNHLVKDLAEQERERMHIWAQATEKLAQAEENTDLEFLLGIISENNTIPVLVADAEGNISQFRNFRLPDHVPADTYSFMELSPRNQQYLRDLLSDAIGNHTMAEMAASNPHFIDVKVFDNTYLYIYYEDSIMLRRLSYYPYIQLLVMIILAGIIYSAIIYTKRAEQNRVWVGLSKETAHQLGTPISSLMAWNEYLKLSQDDQEAVNDAANEMEKDVKRLSVIADRFSKIGSVPELTLQYLNTAIEDSLEYMRNRISGKVEIKMDFSPDEMGVKLSLPLFEWVMENLTKNAVDAMEGAGIITITTGEEKERLYIEVSDTGKGIARKNFKTVFNPGFTTKKRGWGLGLTLVKRIIEEYHGGKIYVKRSELGRGTTFRIELPKG
jgi:nitrogen-specific signal transduction histidine kinase